jgi:ribose/xylose/arabinose/galactoside ABC-type transport system permease subunit
MTTIEPQTRVRTPQLRGLNIRRAIPREYAVSSATLLGLIIVLGLVSPSFLTISNFLDVARVVAITGIMAAGMTFVILTGGIDLSVGSTLGLAAVITSMFVSGAYSNSELMTSFKLPVEVAVLLGLLVGCGVGLANGLIITTTRIEPFIATLGTMIFVRGLVYLVTGGFPILFRSMPAEFDWLGKGYALGIPAPTALFAVVIVCAWWISRRTAFGRAVYAIGGNEEAARLSGINVNRIKILAYTMLGGLAALSGIILASRVGSAEPIGGTGVELTVISGVVIGGTSLIGGHGALIGTVFGVFILGVVQNALNLLGISTDYQLISTGLLLVAAVSLDGYIRTRRRD